MNFAGARTHPGGDQLQTLRIRRELRDVTRSDDHREDDGTVVVLYVVIVLAWVSVSVMAWQVFAK